MHIGAVEDRQRPGALFMLQGNAYEIGKTTASHMLERTFDVMRK